MTDDLVKRLHEKAFRIETADLLDEAADRIEQDAQHIYEMYGLIVEMKAKHTKSKNRIKKLEAALRDVLLWGDHCEACDYDDDWAKIEVRSRMALGGKDHD